MEDASVYRRFWGRRLAISGRLEAELSSEEVLPDTRHSGVKSELRVVDHDSTLLHGISPDEHRALVL